MTGWLIFVLLLIGFVVGVVGTASITLIQRRRQRRLDISYRERNATKAVGEMPNVEELIKSAMMRDVDEEAQIEVPRTSIPGPLHTGSKSCFRVSINGYSALGRSRQFSLSQAEEVEPIYDTEGGADVRPVMQGEVEGEGGPPDVEGDDERPVPETDAVDTLEANEDEEDPETPWIPANTSKSFADGTPVDETKSECRVKVDACVMIPTSRPRPMPARRKTPIGANVEPRGLDASASDIITNPEGRKEDARVRSSFDPPFEMARGSLNGAGAFGLDKGEERGKSERDAGTNSDEALHRSPVKSPLRNNPFASELDEEEVDLIKAEIQAGC